LGLGPDEKDGPSVALSINFRGGEEKSLSYVCETHPEEFKGRQRRRLKKKKPEKEDAHLLGECDEGVKDGQVRSGLADVASVSRSMESDRRGGWGELPKTNPGDFEGLNGKHGLNHFTRWKKLWGTQWGVSPEALHSAE